jgi:hypothetical protein
VGARVWVGVLVCDGVAVRVAVAATTGEPTSLKMSGRKRGGSRADRVARAFPKPASRKVANVIRRVMKNRKRFLRDRFDPDICCSFAIRV